MDLFFEIIEQTPYWVYLIFIALVMIGLKSTRSRIVSIKKLLLLPIIFTIWNLIWLSERIQGHYFLLVFWILGLGAGGFFGWLMVRRWVIHVYKIAQSALLPGSWSPLILILLVFVVRYFFVFNYTKHPQSASHLFLSDALISGVITGIFIGRSTGLILKYRKGSKSA